MLPARTLSDPLGESSPHPQLQGCTCSGVGSLSGLIWPRSVPGPHQVHYAGPLSIPSPLAPHHSHCQAQPDRPQHTSTVRAAMDLALLDCVSSCQPGKGLLRSGLRVPCSGTASRCSTAVLQGGLWCGPAAATLPLCCSVTWQGAWCRHAMMYIGPSWLSQPAATRRALNLNEFGWSFGLKCCSEGASAVV